MVREVINMFEKLKESVKKFIDKAAETNEKNYGGKTPSC